MFNLRGVLTILATCVATPGLAQGISGGRWLDLTHAFNERSVYWPTSETFTKTEVFHGYIEGGWFYSAHNFFAAEHGGTHMDSLIHFAEGANTTDKVPFGQLIGPGIVIDVTAKVAADVDYLVSASDIKSFEDQHEQIPSGAIVLSNTGRAGLYSDIAAYMGTAERGAAAVDNLHFPGLGEDGAVLLVARGIAAVGLDTPSIDRGPYSRRVEPHKNRVYANAQCQRGSSEDCSVTR